jgi:hypothetical protein
VLVVCRTTKGEQHPIGVLVGHRRHPAGHQAGRLELGG